MTAEHTTDTAHNESDVQPEATDDQPEAETQPVEDEQDEDEQERDAHVDQDSDTLPPLSWTTDEYRHTEKGPDWYIAVGVITASIVITAIIFQDYLFAALIVIAVATLVLYGSREPKEIEVSVDDAGITIANEYLPFSTLEAFWIEEQKDLEHPLLLIKSSKPLAPLFTVWINEDQVDPEDVRDQLLAFLPQEELHEPLPQRIMEWLGF